MLPPGSFSEYLALLNLRLDAAEKITLKLFSLVWSESFGARLAIREKTQHAQCAQCVKHKHILRHLRGDLKARRGQQKLYAEHLERQYRDRVVYWRARSCSRLKTPLPSNHVVVAMILDAIDHSKFKYPRSRVFASKELSTYIRPTMDVMGCLVHGHSCFLALSEPFLPKGSSFCADLVLHCLHRLARHGLDLRGVALHLQSDNTSKETKNNTLLRLSALLIALHRLKNIVLCQLESGHSHEDIDQWFSVITSVLQTHHEIHTPAQFVEVLNKWLRDPSTRVHETTERHAFLVESTRDWKTFLAAGCKSNHLVGVGGPGAPHVFAFDRRSDLGLEDEDVDSRFWQRLGATPHPSDVVLRTKQYMSDPDSSYSRPILYLPYAVAVELAQQGAVPEGQF
ncbi:unnamed protein product [Symbiodinium natans]|uniref:DUF7869 domain-containing protein n=1 Tax=Symbiodinium natans TaxID=878477 RepID=A0A812S3P9_9DINO|nr:unnamed protein product [Symbiodinium natans]